MGERPDETLRKWEQVNEQKKYEGVQLMKIIAEVSPSKSKPRPKPKPKGKKK